MQLSTSPDEVAGQPSRRGEYRTSASILAELTDPRGDISPVMVVDLSASGARILTEAEPLDGEYCLDFGVHSRSYTAHFHVARLTQVGQDYHWGVHFSDLNERQTTGLRTSVYAMAGRATFSLLEWPAILESARGGAAEVLVGLSATGEEVFVPAAFALDAGIDGLRLFMETNDAAHVMPEGGAAGS